MSAQGTAKSTICSGCGAEPRLPKQRYGKNCRNEAIRKYRLKRREQFERLRDAVRNFGAHLPGANGRGRC